jgi:hypothetical protein
MSDETIEDVMTEQEQIIRDIFEAPANVEKRNMMLKIFYLLYGRGVFTFDELTGHHAYRQIRESIMDLQEGGYIRPSNGMMARYELTDKGIALAQEGV